MEISKIFIPKEIDSVFKIKLKSLILDYYNSVIAREEEISSFGIFTDSDISGFEIRYNVKSNFNSKSDKWWMAEWKSERISDEKFYNQDNTTRHL